MSGGDVVQERRAALAAFGFVLFGVVGGVVYLLPLPDVVRLGTFGAVGVGAVAATLLGPRWHRPASVGPWRLVTGATALFLLGAVVRPWATEQEGALAATGDVLTMPGYLLLMAGLVWFLIARGGLQRSAVIDGVVVSLGAAVASFAVFGLPAAEVDGRPMWVSAAAAVFPVLDVLLVLVILNLTFTTTSVHPTYLLSLVALVFLLVGDLAYAVIGMNGDLVGPPLLDVPFIVAFACLGAAALHPSMTSLDVKQLGSVQAWSGRRLALLAPAQLAPFLIVVLADDLSMPLRVAVAVTGVGMLAALTVRASSAVRAVSQAQEHFRHLATHDALTGLPNRVRLAQRLPSMLPGRDPAGELWVLFCDLDGFKLVNDSWGHDTGDELIVLVARRLRQVAPERALVARVGGDEFVIAVTGSASAAYALADEVLAALTEPIRLSSADVVVSTSIGLAHASTAREAGSLLRDADTAMYRAKAAGRQRWIVFDASMRQDVRDRVDLELALRHALGSDQMWVAYQPVVDLTTGEVAGAEALCRWTHPVNGPVSPEAFIPVAEESGLIGELGITVLTEALHQLADWRREAVLPPDFVMAVNVSSLQLRDRRLLRAIPELLARTGVPAQCLTLEITESVLVEQGGAAPHVLAALRDLGVGIAVDDFGTGYSSLGYLRRFPVTSVKIDRSFVDGVDASPDDETIVRAITAMASALGLLTVAEGVETPGQRDVVRNIGVRYGQGWLFGRPLTGGDFRNSHLVTSPVRPAVVAGGTSPVVLRSGPAVVGVPAEAPRPRADAGPYGRRTGQARSVTRAEISALGGHAEALPARDRGRSQRTRGVQPDEATS